MDQRTGYSAQALDSFLLRLNDIGAVKIDTKKGFRLKLHDSNPDAPLSPLYFNLRLADNKQGPLGYGEIQQMVEFMYAYIIAQKLRFDGICGIPRAGDPFAEELQKCYFYRLNKDMPRISLDKHEGDKVRQIGNVINKEILKPGAKILLLDDLITKADSKMEAVNRLREDGYVVEECVVFLDREQGGPRQLEFEHGVKLHSITRVSVALEVYKDAKRIDEEQYNTIQAYRASA